MFALNARTKRRIANTCNSAVAILSSFSIVIGSVSQSYAQTITIGDPSAQGTGFLQTSNGTPQMDIATPQSGVSVNKFSEFSVGPEGLILNNSTTAGVSVIGQNVTANPNLVSGPANTIVNEVTTAAPSTLAGTTEVFGQAATVIIANPNGIACNGCDFLNSTSSILTTGTPSVNGADVDLLVTQGTITIGPGGFLAGEQAGLFGRHVTLNGPVATDGQGLNNSLVVSGGAQQVDLRFDKVFASTVVAAPSLVAKTSPFAVDASEAGTLTGGTLRVFGRETGQGINLYGDIDGRDLRAESAGDLFYKNITSRYHVKVIGDDVRQYGDLSATRNVSISGDSFTLYDGRKILTGNYTNPAGELKGVVSITVDDFAVIAGEISGAEITVNVANGSLTNNGFLLSDGELTVVAGDSVLQERKIATEYDVYYDPVLQDYLAAYYAQLFEGGDAADLAAELIARASAHEIIAEYIDDGATATGTNVFVTATAGDVTNTGGAIAATNNVVLTAGNDIINEYLALRSRLDAEDGCAAEDCGYRTDFHAGEILAGNDLSLIATRNIENRASDMAAAQNVTLTAGADIINSLKTSNFEASEFVAVDLIGPRVQTTCGKDSCTNSIVYDYEYTAQDLYENEVNVLSPGRIASLYGNIDIVAGSDFVSQGSEVSSGADLTIDASGQAIFTSYVDDERNFIQRTRRTAYQGCSGGKSGGGCGASVVNVTTSDESFVLATATSNLVGRSVSVTSGENLTVLGARFLAAADLDLHSTTKSVLIDSTDLPDTIALNRGQGVEFVDLTDDIIGQIFRPADFDQQFADYGVTYATLIGGTGVAEAARDETATEAVATILGESVQAWRLGQDDASVTSISGYLALLQTDTARREVLAESLLFSVAAALETQGDAAIDSLSTGLDEYAILQQLITDDASAAALDTAALALLDALLPQLLTQTQGIEASLPSSVALPDLTPEYITAQESTLVDEIIAELAVAVPTDGLAESAVAFERISIDQNFMQSLAVRVANAVAQDMGRAPLFGAPDADGVYENAQQLIDIESDPALQRIVLELSLILSPDNPGTIPTTTELLTLIADGTSTERGIIKISEKLSEFAASAVSSVANTISERDRIAQADAVLALDTTGLTVDTLLTDALVAAVAGSLDTQAAANYQDSFDRNSADYVSLLSDNNLLPAVEALRRAQTGADIKDAARSVGVQSFVSLIDSDVLATLKTDASLAVNGLQSAFDTDVGALNSDISTYHFDVRAQLSTLTDLLTAPDATVEAAMQPALDQVQVDYNAAVATVDQAYQDDLAANEAQYGHLLTQQQYQCSGGKNGSCGFVTVPNQYYIDLKNAADAQALDTHTTALNDAETVRLLDVASVEASFTNPGIQTQIATLSTDYDTQIASYASQKSTLFATLNTQITDAIGKVQLVIAQEALEDQLRASTIAVGTVDAGAPSLATALSAQEFGELSQVGTLQANATGLVENVAAGQSSGNALISSDKAEQDAFLDATAWRFATYRGRNQLSSTPRSVVLSEGDLTTSAAEDIYVTGETALAAVNDITLDAGRRVGLLGAINTNFRLNLGNGTRETGYFEEQITIAKQPVYESCGKDCSTITYVDVPVTENVWVSTGTEAYDDLAYDSFIEIGETLQLGTLMRDVYLAEVPTLDAGTDEIDRLDYARHTGLYDLTSTSVSAGRDLVVNSRGDILNFGGSLVSGENLILTAATDIRNEALRHNFTLTPEHGCVGYGCGQQGHEYKQAEILSGSGIVMSAGGDVTNNGGVIGAAGSILIDAEGDIVNDTLTSQYLYHYVSTSSTFGLKRRKEILHRAVISEGSINTQYGDITLDAGNDIISKGAKISSGGDVTLNAANDILLEAKAEELANYRKRSGFAGLSYGVTRTYWNDFKTAFSQVEGNNIYLNAALDVTGIGALLFAGEDINVAAGEDITFDAHQNLRYEIVKGWSIGISFAGSQIIDAALRGEDIIDAYIAGNPVLSAVQRLATAKGKIGKIFGIVGLFEQGLDIASGIGNAQQEGEIRGEKISFTQALSYQFNPFNDSNGGGLIPGLYDRVTQGPKNSGAGFGSGISVRLGFFRSRRDWTESFVSQVIAGRDLWLDAGKNLSLAGGTIASANENALLSAGENVLASALADTNRSSSSSWGVTVSYNGTWNFGADFNQASASSKLYTNAAITAGKDLDIVSGLDTIFMGANVKARDIYIDAGQDVIVQSRQNTSESESFGFSFHTSGSLSLSYADADRNYTDTPTTITAQDRLSIYTERNTFLLGAVLRSDVGNLSLDTGGLIFDNFQDSDQSTSVNISGSTGASFKNLSWSNVRANGDLGGSSLAYSNTQGITYATIGVGDIKVRDYTNYDFSGLNRDSDNVQRVISHQEYRIPIPGINLNRWVRKVEDTINLYEAYQATSGLQLPDSLRAHGEHVRGIIRNGVLQGLDPDELRALIRSQEFAEAVRQRKSLFDSVQQYGSIDQIPIGIKVAIANGYAVLYGQTPGDDTASIRIPCLTSSNFCQISLDRFNVLFATQGASFLADALSVADTVVTRLALDRGRFSIAELQKIGYGGEISNLLSILVWCASHQPDIFFDLYNNTSARPLLTAFATEIGAKPDVFDDIASAIIAGNRLPDNDAVDQIIDDHIPTLMQASFTVEQISASDALWAKERDKAIQDYDDHVTAVLAKLGSAADVPQTWCSQKDDVCTTTTQRQIMRDSVANLRGLNGLAPSTVGGLVVEGVTLGVGGAVKVYRIVRKFTNRGIDGVWDQGRFTPIQRGNAIEDHLAGTDYNGWTRVGSQDNGFSPAWDFNQGSTWVSLKTLDTGGSGWQTSMRSHIRELETWSSPTNPNAAKVLDIRVQPGGAASAQSLIDYGASRGVQVRINEF